MRAYASASGVRRWKLTHLYPVITVVGWILFRTSSFALLSSSEASRTTEVVPSPTSLSCCVASETKIRAYHLSIVGSVWLPKAYSRMGDLQQGEDGSAIICDCHITDIVHQHLVQSDRSKGRLEDVRHGLASSHYRQSALLHFHTQGRQTNHSHPSLQLRSSSVLLERGPDSQL
jgi:hypothetical protein